MELRMKAMVLEHVAGIETSPLAMRELADPSPGAGQVRVKVRCCAMCRTDLHIIEGELPAHKMPVVPGHQIVGQVDRLGPGSRRLKVGQRVGVAWLRQTDGDCPHCLAGRENLCENQKFTGYDADGGYAQYAVVDEEFAYEIPEGFDDVQAAPLLCAGIVGYRALKRANLPDGGSLAIYGFGSSAHIIAQIAMARGCEIYVVTRGENHRRLALEMGARWAGATADDLPATTDSAIIFAPAGELVPAALEHLGKGGTLSLADIYMTPVPAMDYQKHLFFERDIRSVTANTRADGRELLAEAAKINLRPKTTTYPLADVNRALQDLKSDKLTGTGVIVID
jgi:propanol-preferring alcohol dehydrogenase